MNRIHLKKARLELVPLTDMVFLLLTFFVFAILQMKMQKGLTVDLPVVSTSAGSEDRDYLTITITRNNEIYLNKEKTSLTDLYQKISVLRKGEGKEGLFVNINGDEKASHGVTVQVLGTLQKANVRQVFFEVNDKGN